MSARQEILAAMPPGVWMATPDIKAATGYDCSRIHLILTGECKYKIVEKGPMIKHPQSTNNVVTWRKVARPTDEPPVDKYGGKEPVMMMFRDKDGILHERIMGTRFDIAIEMAKAYHREGCTDVMVWRPIGDKKVGGNV